MGYIYKISNSINDKLYIGQTIRPIESRFKQHLSDAKREDTALYRAMRKHGFENFTISLVEEIDDSMLDEREIYWISFYNSYLKGYNCTLGGSGGCKADYNQIRELWDEGKSVGEICKIIGHNKSVVRVALLDWDTYSIKESLYRSSRKKKVAQYSLDGELIQVFGSLKEATSAFGREQSPVIGMVCNQQKGTAYGYQWRYVDENIPSNIEPTIVNEGSNLIVEFEGKKRGLHELCLSLWDENAYNSIRKYRSYAGCSAQEAFERYFQTSGATRSGGNIVYNGQIYHTMSEASRAANISYNRVVQAKTQFNFSPQEAFDYCLNKPPMDNQPKEILVNGIRYPSITAAIKGAHVNRGKLYKYKKEHQCTMQEAFDALIG